MAQFNEISNFFNQYVQLFESLLEDEQAKLDILIHGDIHALENSLAKQQANALKITNIEKKREELLVQWGMPNYSFKQVIESFESEERQVLEQLYDRVEKVLGNIRFYNQKSMDIVKLNLQLFKKEEPNVYSKQDLVKK